MNRYLYLRCPANEKPNVIVPKGRLAWLAAFLDSANIQLLNNAGTSLDSNSIVGVDL